jgi:two-component system, LytTR family, response regulator
MLNLILIDDEPDARLLLRRMLSDYSDCNILAEAGSCNEAVALIVNNQPDIIFLDIQLKDGTGFDILSQIPNPSFDIIFVTAFDTFALQAFQCNAIDYLLKPIAAEDLKRVFDKVKRRKPQQDDFHKQLQALMRSMQNGKHEQLVLSTSDGIHFLPLSEIIYLKAEGNYTSVFTEKKEHIMVSQNLGSFDYLDAYTEGGNFVTSGGSFFRTHQSFIVNLKTVRQFLKHNDGDFAVLNDNTKIPIARRKKNAFLEAMMLINK